CSGEIPHPESWTSKKREAPRSSAVTVTKPSSVNFTAFETRFERTCLRRVGSETIFSVIGPFLRVAKSTPFSAALGFHAEERYERSSVGENDIFSTVSLPAST